MELLGQALWGLALAITLVAASPRQDGMASFVLASGSAASLGGVTVVNHGRAAMEVTLAGGTLTVTPEGGHTLVGGYTAANLCAFDSDSNSMHCPATLGLRIDVASIDETRQIDQPSANEDLSGLPRSAVVAVPHDALLPPDGDVTFFDDPTRPWTAPGEPHGPLLVQVRNLGAQPANLAYDPDLIDDQGPLGQLVIAVPDGFTVQVVTGGLDCTYIFYAQINCDLRSDGPQEIAFTSVPDVHIQYPAGWNLVAGPSGTEVDYGPLFGQLANADGYASLTDPATVGPIMETYLSGGLGYWVYFAHDEDLALPGQPMGARQQIQRSVVAGQAIPIGNPGTTPAAVLGADPVYIWDPASGYRASTTLQPGQGAWAYSAAGGTITITTLAPAP